MATTLTDALRGGIGSAFDRVHQRILVAEWKGRILAVDLRGNLTVLGTGYDRLEDIAVAGDGGWALVTERGGSLLRVPLDNADRAQATVVTSRLRSPHQIALVERRNVAYVVEHASAGRLVAVTLPTGTTRSIVDGLQRAVGLVVTRDLRTAYVTEQATGGGRVTEIALRTRRRSTLAAGLTNPFMLAWADEGETALLVPERDPGNRLLRVDRRERGPLEPSAPRPLPIPLPGGFGPGRGRLPLQPRFGRERFLGRRLRPQPLLEALDTRPSSAVVLEVDRIAVVADATVTVHDLRPVPALRVDFDLGTEPLFVGAYLRVPVQLSGSGVSFDDLVFTVVEGPEGGQLSHSRDETFTPSAPHVMLLAGSRPGTYTLRAARASTGDVLGEAAFEVTDLWKGGDGPPLWFEGISQPAVTGSAWGGGAVGPQNVDLVPASGTRNVAVLLVDTATRRFPSDSSASVQEWRDEAMDGVTAGGATRSSRLFYQEVSQGTFDLSLDGVYGPVQLPGEFEDYFSLNDNNLWVWRAGFFQSAVTAGDGLIDYSDVDSLVVVVRSAPAADPTSSEPAENMRRFAWPWATGGVFTTGEGNQSMGVVVMPDDWGDSSDREIHDTLSHELGHNLGLPDLYMDAAGFGAIAGRDIGSWDMMSWDDPLPHVSAPNKMRLGWIRPDWVKTYDFAASGAVDETVTLFASELGEPTAGAFSAVEVRLADGWNYYFEYRSAQTGDIGDQQLPADRRVLGTDVASPDYSAPVARREIILLPQDPDGDGPVLDVGEDYEELDVSDPMFPSDFSVEVISTDDDSAQIRVRYGVNSKPDPSIRPWPGSGTNAWQSPDIEVRNAKNAADAEFANLPWTGHPNTIVAKVKNAGSLLASDVRVHFSVKDFTAGGGAETPLGSDVRDVPVGSTVEFTFDGWVPPAGGHFCVVARIPLHVEAGPPTIVEMTELNNRAQSNYTEFISAEASPPERRRGVITVGNPFSLPTRAHLVPSQTNPFFRTYLGRTSVDLAPGEERRIEVMFEAMHGTPDVDRVLRQDKPDEWLRKPNHVAIAGAIEDPDDPQLHSLHAMGGVVVRVRTGKATRVEAGADGNTVFGRAMDADGKDVRSGSVIVAVRKPGEPESERTAVATVTDGGFHAEFREAIHGEGLEATASYLGDGQWAPSPEFRFTT